MLHLIADLLQVGEVPALDSLLSLDIFSCFIKRVNPLIERTDALHDCGD